VKPKETEHLRITFVVIHRRATSSWIRRSRKLLAARVWASLISTQYLHVVTTLYLVPDRHWRNPGMGGWREVGCTGTGASFRFDPFNAKRKGQPRTNTLSLPSSASSSATSPTENASEITGMRPTWTRLAKSVTTKPLNLRHASASLLPPIPCVRFQVVTPQFFRELRNCHWQTMQVIPGPVEGSS